MSTPHDYKVLIDQPDAATPCYCSDCDWKGPFSDLAEINDCSLTPGDPSPAGRCPTCDSLAYISDETEQPDCVRTGNHGDDGRGMCPTCNGLSNKERDAALAERRPIDENLIRLISAVAASLTAWEGEEDSVQEEHRDMIDELQAAFDALGKIDAPPPPIIAALLMDALTDAVAELESTLEEDSEPEELITLPRIIKKGNAAIEAYMRAQRGEVIARIGVCLEGGLVCGVVSDQPDMLNGVEVLVIDYDTEGADESDLVKVPQKDAPDADAMVHERAISSAGIDLTITAARLAARDEKGAAL